MKIFKTITLIIILLLVGFHQNQINAQNLGCDPDEMGPIMICDVLSNIYPGVNEEVIISATIPLEGANDNCTSFDDMQFFITLDIVGGVLPTTTFVTLPPGSEGIFQVAVWGVDSTGNSNLCWGEINVVQNTGACDPDDSPPTINCNNFVNVSGVPGEDITLEAEWLVQGTAQDSCTSAWDIEYFLSLDTTLTSPPTDVSLIFPAGTNDTVEVVVWAVDEAGNFSSCHSIVSIESVQIINGFVFVDDNGDCLYDNANEEAMGGFTVQYTTDQGLTFNTVETNSDGFYFIFASGLQTGDEILVELLLPNGISSGCPTSSSLLVAAGAGILNQDFSINLSTDCDLMVTDISTNNLRRCFPSTYYASYCNLSSYDISGVELIVNLSDDMTINSTGLPFTNLGNNQILFDLGTVPSGFCGQIPINVTLSCVVPLGATVCVESTISPYGCGNNLWAGSTLQVEGECDDQNDVVEFTITNIGLGTMPAAENFLVVEDVVMYMNSTVQLGPNESETFTVAANGSTWRVEIPQEPGHPSLSIASKTIEGCGGYGSMGFINLFPTPDVDPYFSIDCSEVVGSYDPNDKSAVPVGVSEEHFIEPNTSIEYKIRFQNTGTDTAFTVRIEDRISDDLDFSSIQPGASSHPYRIEVQEDGLLIFHFENIMLPDSFVNEPASNGFVQFRIDQLSDNPIGTVIENTADIYFDFNEAVVTNTVTHTIGNNFVTTGTNKILVPNLEITAVPNPFSTETLFSLNGIEIQNGQFELFDLTGRLIKNEEFSGNQYQLKRNGIPSGTYLFRFVDEKGILANGKIVIQ